LQGDDLEHIADGFSSLAHEMMSIDERSIDVHAALTRLTLLCQQLKAALPERPEGSPVAVLTTVAQMEARGVEMHVAWLDQHLHHSENCDLISRFSAAANQGWTAIDLLQRTQG
jgi:hypothetical protein